MRTRNSNLDTIRKMLGERIAESRKKLGLTQAELGAGMGERYDQKAVSAVECGRSGLKLDGLVNVAKMLTVSIDYLLGLTDDPTPTPKLALYKDDPVGTETEEHGGNAAFTDPSHLPPRRSIGSRLNRRR